MIGGNMAKSNNGGSWLLAILMFLRLVPNGRSFRIEHAEAFLSANDIKDAEDARINDLVSGAVSALDLAGIELDILDTAKEKVDRLNEIVDDLGRQRDAQTEAKGEEITAIRKQITELEKKIKTIEGNLASLVKNINKEIENNEGQVAYIELAQKVFVPAE
jgi:hypothetical protein